MNDSQMPSHEQRVLIDNIVNALSALDNGSPHLAVAILDHMLAKETEKLDVMVEIEQLMKRIGL